MGFGETNIGDVDRAARLIVAIALLYALGAGLVSSPLSYVAALVMLGLFFTVATGTCWLYSLMGISTCHVAAKAAPARKAAPAKRARKARKRRRK